MFCAEADSLQILQNIQGMISFKIIFIYRLKYKMPNVTQN